MKQSIQILVFSLSLVITGLNAQSSVAKVEIEEIPQVRDIFDNFYLSMGINLSSTTNHIDYDRRPGITFGISTDMDGSTIPFIKNVSVMKNFRYQLAIGYEQFGSKWSESEKWAGGESSNKVKFRFNYIAPRISFTYDIKSIPGKPYVKAGLKPRILVGGTESWKFKIVGTLEGMEYSDTQKGERDIKDNLKTLDFGFVLAVGKPFTVKGQDFTGELKYEFGLRNIWDFSESDMNGSNNSKLKNNTIGFKIGWRLAFGR
jgi:hypothetical protein